MAALLEGMIRSVGLCAAPSMVAPNIARIRTREAAEQMTDSKHGIVAGQSGKTMSLVRHEGRPKSEDQPDCKPLEYGEPCVTQ